MAAEDRLLTLADAPADVAAGTRGRAAQLLRDVLSEDRNGLVGFATVVALDELEQHMSMKRTAPAVFVRLMRKQIEKARH